MSLIMSGGRRMVLLMKLLCRLVRIDLLRTVLCSWVYLANVARVMSVVVNIVVD